jgi:hypothetical protein
VIEKQTETETEFLTQYLTPTPTPTTMKTEKLFRAYRPSLPLSISFRSNYSTFLSFSLLFIFLLGFLSLSLFS